jgi:hypothetical protein
MLAASTRCGFASPIVLTFDSLAFSDAAIHEVGQTYTENGFLFTNIYQPQYSAAPPELQFAVFGAASYAFPGSPALFNHNGSGLTQLTRADGGAFDLVALDLFENPASNDGGITIVDRGIGRLTFTGITVDSTVVVQSFFFSQFPDRTTITFDGFENLSSVYWYQGADGDYPLGHQFDNVEVNPVPEPNSLSLIVSGMCGLAFAWRRRVRIQLHPFSIIAAFHDSPVVNTSS